MEHNKFERFEKKALETVYAEPEETFHRKLIPQMVARFMPEFTVSFDDFILDVGCGPGIFLNEMKELHYEHVVGITMSDEDIEICGKKELTVMKSEMSDIDIQDGAVDFIWCRQALEHSAYPLFTLFEFNRVLKNGGQAYIEVPAPNSQRPHEENPNHYSILGNNMWNALFVKAGFKIMFNHYLNIELDIEGKKIPEQYIIYGIEKCTRLFPEMN